MFLREKIINRSGSNPQNSQTPKAPASPSSSYFSPSSLLSAPLGANFVFGRYYPNQPSEISPVPAKKGEIAAITSPTSPKQGG